MLDKLLDDPSKIGAMVFALIAVAAFARRWVVPYDTHQEALAQRDAQIDRLTIERDEFKRMAMQSIEVAERTQRVRGGGFVGRKE